MSERRFPERKKGALDNIKLRLSAQCPTAKDKKSSLAFRLVNNNPRIIVYTNDPNDQSDKNNGGTITANLDAPTFFVFLDALYQVCESKEATKVKIENKNYIYPNGKRSEDPLMQSELYVGKDEEGVVWMSVIHYNKERPRIKFEFGLNDFHHLYHGDGKPFTKGEQSLRYARSYIRILENIMSHMLVTEYIEPERKDRDGGRGNRRGNDRDSGGGNNNDGYNGDDDLPF